MDITLIISLLIVILAILFVLALIAPARFTAWGGSKPHRGKAFLYLLVGFILLLWLGTMADDVLMKKIDEAPEEITELVLENEELKAFPEYLPKLVNLEEINFGFNEIESIDENIRGLKKLRWLLLDNNPITDVPDWILDFEDLAILRLNNTNIDSSSLPILETLIARGVNVTYDETLITGKTVEQTEKETETAETETSEEDEHAESFSEFAKRRLLGGRGTDHRRKYGKGEIFYESGRGIEHALLDSLGAALTDVGLFSDDKEVSAKLVKEGDLYQLKLVTIYKEKSEITEDIRAGWQLIAIIIAGKVFEDATMELYLCDQEWNVLDKISIE